MCKQVPKICDGDLNLENGFDKLWGIRFSAGIPMTLLSQDLITLFFPLACAACKRSLQRDVPPGGKQHVAVCPSLDNASIATMEMQRLESVFWSAAHRDWCRDCWSRLGIGTLKQCRRCSAQLSNETPNPFGDRCCHCVEFEFHFDRVISLGNYADMLQQLVVGMKNRRDDRLAVQFGKLLSTAIKLDPGYVQADWVISVPTHWRRRLFRGFSGPEIIADRIAQTCQLRQSWRHVRVKRPTKKQGQLSLVARTDNVHNAFSVSSNVDWGGKTVVLIDDVVTSGATCSEIAKVLKSAGAKQVLVAAVARATGVR